jgi:undecaprenyl-diphosphatase
VTVFEAFILGLIQGLTEFLPVSSSGHLVMAQTLLRDVPLPGIFLEVMLHVATLMAVVVVYRDRLLQLILGAVARQPGAWTYIGLLALATVPAGLVGLFLRDQVEILFDTPAVTGFMLLITGAILISTRWAMRRRTARDVGIGVALAMGIAQAFAILPGISRSGTSIAAGLWGRVSGEKVAEFSFLMSIPAIAGAAVLELRDLDGLAIEAGPTALIVGFMAALVSGIAAILMLLWLIRRQNFHAFAFYVWPVGLLFLLYLWWT